MFLLILKPFYQQKTVILLLIQIIIWCNASIKKTTGLQCQL